MVKKSHVLACAVTQVELALCERQPRQLLDGAQQNVDTPVENESMATGNLLVMISVETGVGAHFHSLRNEGW